MNALAGSHLYGQEYPASIWSIFGDGFPVGAKINTALADINAEGGGILVLPHGTMPCEVPIDLKYNRVGIHGRGPVMWNDGGPADYGSQLFATFNTGAPLLRMRSPYGAGNAAMQGQSLLGLMLNGAGNCPVVLEIDSIRLSQAFVYCTGAHGAAGDDAAIRLTCGVTGTDLAEATNLQECDFCFYVRQIDDAGQRATHCLYVEGSSNANMNDSDLRLCCEHWDGDAFRSVNCDNNRIYIRTSHPGGAGNTIYADSAIGQDGCRANTFLHVAGTGPVHATGAPQTLQNKIMDLDTGNGTPIPTAAGASKWAYIDTFNNMSGFNVI